MKILDVPMPVWLRVFTLIYIYLSMFFAYCNWPTLFRLVDFLFNQCLNPFFKTLWKTKKNVSLSETDIIWRNVL